MLYTVSLLSYCKLHV